MISPQYPMKSPSRRRQMGSNAIPVGSGGASSVAMRLWMIVTLGTPLSSSGTRSKRCTNPLLDSCPRGP